MAVPNKLQEARLIADDWTGITDPAERRRRQNRLHQRAWRRRKELQQASPAHTPPGLVAQGTARPPATLALPFDDSSLRRLVVDHVTGRQRMPIAFELPQSRFEYWDLLGVLGEPQSLFAYWAELRVNRKREITTSLLSQHPSLALRLRSKYDRDHVDIPSPQLNVETSQDDYTSSATLPLSVDHQLIVMIQYNALRGVMSNLSILLHLDGRKFEGWDSFYTEDLVIPPEDVPPALRQTELQRTIPHESWVDVIPYPNMRDNILQDQDKIDLDDLCDDFLGGLHQGLSEVQGRGIILWGEPWSEDGWEVSEGFAQKWSSILRGCEGLIETSNRWREKRGEGRLVVEL